MLRSLRPLLVSEQLTVDVGVDSMQLQPCPMWPPPFRVLVHDAHALDWFAAARRCLRLTIVVVVVLVVVDTVVVLRAKGMVNAFECQVSVR